MWPANIDPKKKAIMTRVQIARVMKVCFFFSCSDSSFTGAFSSSVAQPAAASARFCLVTLPFLVGLLELLPFGLARLRSSVGESDVLPRLMRRSRCWNLMSFLGLVMVAAWYVLLERQCSCE